MLQGKSQFFRRYDLEKQAEPPAKPTEEQIKKRLISRSKKEYNQQKHREDQIMVLGSGQFLEDLLF